MSKIFVGILLIFVYSKLSHGLERGLDSSTMRPSTTVRPLSEKFVTKNLNNNLVPIDNVIKRNIKIEDLSKTFEPSQEFKRGPNYDREREGFGVSSRTFGGQQNYGYDNRYPPKAGIGSVYSSLAKSKNGLLERIGVGSGLGQNSYSNSDRYGSNSYSSYGSPPLDYSKDYSYGQGYGNNEYSSDYGSSGYGSSNNQDIVLQKIAFAKKVLLPIAGVAALGIAAAYIVNPMLFQYGSSGSFGKRRKRDLKYEENKFENELYSQNLAYKNYKKI